VNSSSNGSESVWEAPLPDFSTAALSQRLRIGEREFHLQLNPVQHDPPGEPGTDLVQLRVQYRGRPLTLADLGIDGAKCSSLWTFLCSKVVEAALDFYGPHPLPSGEPNPRLGCWGYRPDLAERGLKNDCALAVVIGVSVDTRGARPLGGDREYLRALRDAVSESLAYWVLTGLGRHPEG
jgi:hypothetical protein